MDTRNNTNQEASQQAEIKDGSPKRLPEASPLKTWGEAVRELFPQANDEDVDFILWEMTCYPFDTTRTLQQLSELAAEVKPAEEGWELRMLKVAERNAMSEGREASAKRRRSAAKPFQPLFLLPLPTPKGRTDPMSTDLLPCPFCGVDPVSRRSAGDTWEITCDEGECGWACVYAFTEEDAIAQWQTRRFPATPAPESPAPAPGNAMHALRVELLKPGFSHYQIDTILDRIISLGWRPAPEVGTGSETSPEPAAQFWKDLENLLDFLGHKRGEVLELCVNPGRLEEVLDSIATVCGAHLEAKPAKASDAEQIPHPVAEAEQSPQPAGGLVWTKEKPTEVGYYWSVVPLKNALPPQIVFIDERPAGLVAYATDGRSGLLENTNKDTQWAGPIPEPLAQAPTRNAGEAQP